MQSRANYNEMSPDLFKKLLDLAMATKNGTFKPFEIDLINIRASQMNGCAFCLDMHVKEAKIHGERELRVHHISIWRESNLFSDRERAMLEWTEANTKLGSHGITDETYAAVKAHLTEKEMSELSFSVGIINLFNRLNIGFPKTPGSLDAAYGLTKSGLN